MNFLAYVETHHLYDQGYELACHICEALYEW